MDNWKMELSGTSDNPVPSDAHVGTVFTPDGIQLRYARWLPSTKNCKGTVTLLHGRTEFIEKYFEVIRELRDRGFAVVTFDWRGQGKSQRMLTDSNLGHVESFWDYVSDLETVFKKVVLPDSPAPHYAFAHSTGGAILLLAADRFQSRLERVILAAPLVDLRISDSMYRYVLKLVPILNFGGLKYKPVPNKKKLAFQGLPFESNLLTSDPVRYERISRILTADDELAIGNPTIGWLNAAQKVFSILKKPDFGNSIRLPMLIIAAGMDEVVSNSSTEKLASRMPLATYMELNGSKHDILIEVDSIRQQFWVAFDVFIRSNNN